MTNLLMCVDILQNRQLLSQHIKISTEIRSSENLKLFELESKKQNT